LKLIYFHFERNNTWKQWKMPSLVWLFRTVARKPWRFLNIPVSQQSC
jgi:hypothetical protein